MASLVYTNAQSQTVSNRITTAGYEYDPAGNQTRGQTENGTWQRYKYDSAGRLAVALDDSSNPQETYSYGASNERLMTVYGNGLGAPATYYCWEGGQVIADFRAGTSNNLVWEKSYVYLGGRLLATTDLYGTKYHHPDRLGTRLVTDGANGTVTTEQVNLPYGTALTSESSGGFNNRRFTSYDRSATTGMDYAVNRFYNPEQGRFNQVDPIGMGAVRLGNPQSLNLYGYCENDPINHIDPDGLFLGKLFGWVGKAFKFLFKVAAIALFVVAMVLLPAMIAAGGFWLASGAWFGWGSWAGLMGAAGLAGLAGWHNGKLGAIAGAFLNSLSGGGNFRTPATFPNGTGVGGVNNFLANDPIAKKKAEEIARKKAQREIAKKVAKTIGKSVARRIFRIGDLLFPEPVGRGGDLPYEEHVRQAQKQYPDKAGTYQEHHIIPKYLGGDPHGETVRIDAAYHQVITNDFRRFWPYRGDPGYRGRLPTPQELKEVVEKVYSINPLPPK